MARDSGDVMKIGLLAVGGYAVWRWWSGREAPAEGRDGTPAGITPEEQALLDSARRTSAGGPQPGDTSSVEEREEDEAANGIEEQPLEEQPLRAELLSRAQADPVFGGRYNVHQWNWVLRALTGLTEAQTPDLGGVGDPADNLTVDQYLTRRNLAGLSSTPSIRTAHHVRSGRGGGGMRGLGQLRRARYPVWQARPGGRTACACASTGCNCYRV